MLQQITTDKAFDELVDGGSHNRPQVVVFYTPTCHSCMQFKPVVEEFSSDPRYRDKFVFNLVNSMTVRDNTSDCDVSAYPTTVIIRHGKLVSKFIGTSSRENFAAHLNTFIFNNKL